MQGLAVRLHFGRHSRRFWRHPMTPIRLAFVAALALPLALGACASKPASEMPAATAAAAAKPAPAVEESDELPLERSEAAGQCWMKYDRSGGSLEAKAKLVDKCIDDKMKKGK
jgi:hypothetical protein